MRMTTKELCDLKFWYRLNLLEGEGLGSSYEYVNKLCKLRSWFSDKRLNKVVIAGLPGKYGFSLDLILFSFLAGANVIIVADDRQAKIKALTRILKSDLWPVALRDIIQIKLLTRQQLTSPRFYKDNFDMIDLVINSEVVQNWTKPERVNWVEGMTQLTSNLVIFVPNKGNQAHMTVSKLKNLSIDEVNKLTPKPKTTGYIDMPPFPPGIKRSDEQKGALAESKFFWFPLSKALEMWMGLQNNILSGLLPSRAHLIYLFVKN